MAMNFYQAQRAQNPDLVNATMQQAQIAGQLREQQQAEKMGYMSGGMGLAEKAPAGAWSDLGASMGIPGMEGAGAAAAEAGIMEGLAAEAAGLDALAAGATGAEAAGATAAIEGATAGAGATPGVMSALGAMGPMGWAALAALGLGLANQG